jgi:SOS-response transcriptional repressor LexA
MEAFGERLTDLLRALGVTQKDFAQQLGVTPSGVSAYINNKSTPNSDVLAVLVQQHPKVNVRWLLLGEGSMFEDTYRVEYSDEEQARRGQPRGVPVVSRIRAGLSTLYEIDQYAERHLNLDPETISLAGDRPFGLVVEGYSMSPFMLPGDVVVCSAFRAPEVGDDVAFYRARTGESTIKRLDGFDKKARRVKLLPLNPDYETFVTTLEHGDQLAVSIGLYRNLRDRRQQAFSI